jgi:hypothetical protein
LGYISYLRPRKASGIDFLSVHHSDTIKLDVEVPLKYVKSKVMPGPTLVLRVSTIGNIQAGELEIANAKVDVAHLESRAAGLTTLEVVDAVQSSDLMPVLGTLLESILKIGDEFAKVSCLPSMHLHDLLICIEQDPPLYPGCVDSIAFSLQGI